MKKNLCLTFLLAIALTASSQDFAPLTRQTDLSSTANSTSVAQAEEYPVPRIAVHVNPVGYFLFAGEQHGFRKAANIQRCLDAELAFYAIEVFKIGLMF